MITPTHSLHRMSLKSPAELMAFLAGLALGLFVAVGIHVLIGLIEHRREEKRQRRPYGADKR